MSENPEPLAALDTLDALTWRRLTLDDAAAYAEVMNTIAQHDGVSEFYDAADALDELRPMEEFLPESSVAVFAGDALVGYAVADYRPPAGSTELYRILIYGGVRPDHRRRGMGRRILRQAAADAGAMHVARHPAMPHAINVMTAEQVEASAALYRAEGYEPVRFTKVMKHPLGDRVPAPTTPDGMVFEDWSEANDAEFLAIRNEAFADHWGSVPNTPEMWRTRVLNRAFRPELSLLARDVATGTAAGMVVGSHWEAEAAVTGLREAHLHLVGTRREFRRRGVAGALIAQALRRAVEHSYDFSALSVDAANPTGAFGVYEKAGFTASETYVRWEWTPGA